MQRRTSRLSFGRFLHLLRLLFSFNFRFFLRRDISRSDNRLSNLRRHNRLFSRH
ncbi:hypothetical protein HanRHA438_Chr05g0233761 [Helianthus annuus]|uniref:Uncharacterized protein n=1 Tax=Helianthus annuus TaxID=4232 RepID=A0A9K3NPI5_HELAN|nr:hypothetical protein HanXRQr2_Chr05g0224761 [Helianthus annuus]KAJ0919794.1 hypothetical protein HanRHA438_Chr05g0233761 [Helianthus annuus]